MSGTTTDSNAALATRPAFLAFVLEESDRAVIAGVSESHGWSASNIYEGNIATATDFLRNNASPMVLVAEISSAAEAPAQLDALADVCAPDVKVIIIGNVNEYSFFCWLTDLGVSSYLLRPLTAEAMEGALKKAMQPAGGVGDVSTTKEPAHVIGVVGARGGAGASTLSTVLALMISRQLGKQTGLVDLDPQDGSISMHLELEPSRGLRDALEKPDRIDGLFIDRVMTRTSDKFAVLSAEEPMGEVIHYHPQAADCLFKEMRDKFEVIVVDLPRRFDEFTSQCFRLSEKLVLVTEPSLLGLRDTLRMTDAFRERLGLTQPFCVLSKVGMMPKQEIPQAEFEKGAGLEMAATIPFAPDLMVGSNGDFPVLQSSGSKNYQALRGLVESLLPDFSFPEVVPAKKGFQLFKKGG